MAREKNKVNMRQIKKAEDLEGFHTIVKSCRPLRQDISRTTSGRRRS
jgi:hypothetical protein